MKKSYMVAVGLVIVFTLWMLSGLLTQDTELNADSAKDDQAFSVEVKQLKAQSTPIYLVVQGQSVPNRTIDIRAQTEGVITQIDVIEGTLVEKGAQLLKLDLEDRQAQLEQAQSALSVSQKNLQRISKLATKQYQSDNELEQAKADVKTAEANIARIQLDIKHTTPELPITAFIERLHVEQGDFLRVGDSIASIIETDPLVIEAQVAQQQINHIELGTSAEVMLGTGNKTTAQVRFISPKANEESRTFLVELAVENPNHQLKSGTSARVKFLLRQQLAHYVSAALFSLSSEGEIGIKTVNAANQVVFNQVDIVQSDEKGSWVLGLPETARVIVTGQGFVQAGATVNVVETGDN
ncbi:efflux RND transporter periplasmic adaptor subunit [Glaciecola sp. 1036]|uniref:efflux RND transporter periplasmic adaptor subunit n=1 Tax=Alteromonadaceae TaxID=72275 RepID=UPI003D08F0C8